MAFEPENDLEQSLMRAAVDAAHRPQFYHDFVASEIVAVTMGPQFQEHGNKTLNAGENVALMTISIKGKPVIPIFSSLTRMTSRARRKTTHSHRDRGV